MQDVTFVLIPGAGGSAWYWHLVEPKLTGIRSQTRGVVMVPPPFTGQLWVIYLTGILEIAGAMGLLMRPTRRLAGICLLLLLLALFPANVYTAMQDTSKKGTRQYPANL